MSKDYVEVKKIEVPQDIYSGPIPNALINEAIRATLNHDAPKATICAFQFLEWFDKAPVQADKIMDFLLLLVEEV
jgi:hypothetical protein